MSRSFHHHLESVFLTEVSKLSSPLPPGPPGRGGPGGPSPGSGLFGTPGGPGGDLGEFHHFPTAFPWDSPLGFPYTAAPDGEAIHLLAVAAATKRLSLPDFRGEGSGLDQLSMKFVKICVNLKWIYNIGYVAHIVGINGK